MSGIREVCFDTETTGFHARGDDRITELGCIELIDMIPTGKQYHAYLNPQRDVPEKVTQITGLTTDFLKKNGQYFADVAAEFLEFVGDSKLIAHNANFDKAFINAELEKAGCVSINAARVAAAPASLECKMTKISDLQGSNNFLVLGEVIGVHMDDACMKEGRFDVTTFQPLARLGYRDYSVVKELFELNRPDD